jgi:hypothetical protein
MLQQIAPDVVRVGWSGLPTLFRLLKLHCIAPDFSKMRDDMVVISTIQAAECCRIATVQGAG